MSLIRCCCGVDCAPSQTITVNVKAPDGSALAGATVVLTGPGGYTSTLTSNGSGIAVFNWTSFGNYSATASFGGYTNGTATVTTTACHSYTLNVCVGGTRFTANLANLCDFPASPVGKYSFITAQFIQSGGVVATVTSPPSNVVTADLPPGISTSVNITSSNPRWAGGTYSFGVGLPCTGFNVNIPYPVPASGYDCLCDPTHGGGGAPCTDPVKGTLILTDPILGLTVSLLFVPGVGNLYWEGTSSYHFPGCNPVLSTCPAADVPVTYRFGNVSGQCKILVSWPVGGTAPHTGCPGGSPTAFTDSALMGYTVGACPGGFTATSDAFPSGGYGLLSCFAGVGQTLTITE